MIIEKDFLSTVHFEDKYLFGKKVFRVNLKLVNLLFLTILIKTESLNGSIK